MYSWTAKCVFAKAHRLFEVPLNSGNYYSQRFPQDFIVPDSLTSPWSQFSEYEARFSHWDYLNIIGSLHKAAHSGGLQRFFMKTLIEYLTLSPS